MAFTFVPNRIQSPHPSSTGDHQQDSKPHPRLAITPSQDPLAHLPKTHLPLTAALFPTASSTPVISLFFFLSYPRILGICSSEWPLSSGFCDEFTFNLLLFLVPPSPYLVFHC